VLRIWRMRRFNARIITFNGIKDKANEPSPTAGTPIDGHDDHAECCPPALQLMRRYRNRASYLQSVTDLIKDDTDEEEEEEDEACTNRTVSWSSNDSN
jgi:hypothetical protein